jgi:putative Holliday junction resolvase
MARIMAIDYGHKRTGIAVTDILQISAQGLKTVSTLELLPQLEDYFLAEEVEQVVIGYPKQMNNTPSEAVTRIDAFIRAFQKKFPDLPIITFDERFTSKMAFQAMIDGGVRKERRRDKALVDKISATIILQSYMEHKENMRNR